MAGATAASAAGVTASQANTITINLSNNYIAGPDGNHLNADLTGDGHPDLTIAGAYAYRIPYQRGGSTFYASRVGVNLNGVFAGGYFFQWDGLFSAVLGSQRKVGYLGGSAISLTGSILIFFKDLHINGGAPTRGSLEVTVGPISPHGGIQLDSLTYNTPVAGRRVSAVPDEGSTLALLAMGAGGILAFRRWRAEGQGMNWK